MQIILKLFSVVIVMFMAVAASAEGADKENLWREGEFRGTVILTLTGNVALPTRKGSSEEVDKFFYYNDLEFSKAAQFDFSALKSLPQTQIKADFPKGGPIYTFEGPLLGDVLNAAGATGETVTIRALDGYSVDIPTDEAIEKGAVVALLRDGIPFAIGDFGPTHVVFPRADRAELSEMNDDWWVWSIYSINVE